MSRRTIPVRDHFCRRVLFHETRKRAAAMIESGTTPPDIRRGIKRRNIYASMELVGRNFRNGVTRERIRQIESAQTLTPLIVRDYRKALAKIVAELKKRREAGQEAKRAIQEVFGLGRRKEAGPGGDECPRSA